MQTLLNPPTKYMRVFVATGQPVVAFTYLSPDIGMKPVLDIIEEGISPSFSYHAKRVDGGTEKSRSITFYPELGLVSMAVSFDWYSSNERAVVLLTEEESAELEETFVENALKADYRKATYTFSPREGAEYINQKVRPYTQAPFALYSVFEEPKPRLRGTTRDGFTMH